MYDKQYIAFSHIDPENPELFSDLDVLLKYIKQDIACSSFPHRPRSYTKIIEIEIEEFASVSGRWEDVTERLYTLMGEYD